MKPATLLTISVASAALITSCVLFETRIADVTGPEVAAAIAAASCTGGREFVEAASATLDPATAAALVKGVETACALRAERTPISATRYDDPLDSFCAETPPLDTGDAAPAVRITFNTRRATLCEARP